MLLSMAKVQIVGTKSQLGKTVSLLQRMGVVQIDTWNEARSLSQQRMTYDSKSVRLRERLAYAITQVEAVVAALPTAGITPSAEYETFYSRSAGWLLDEVESGLVDLKPQVQALSNHHDELEEQLSSLPRYEATLRQLLPLVPTFIELELYATTAIWVERHHQFALAAIAQNLEKLTGGMCEIISREVDRDVLAAILVFPKSQAGAVSKLLGQESISQIRLPSEFAGLPFEEALTNIRQNLQDIPGRLAEVETQLKALAKHWCPRLLTWQALLRDQLAQIDMQTNLGQTDYTFVLEGWIPKDQLTELESALAVEVSSEVVVTELGLQAAARENAPVALHNPRFARPFEPLVGLLALPKQGAIDPTPLMAIFMPIFFGLILGDIAYGAILLALTIYLRRRFKDRPLLQSLTEVLMFGSLWSIVFGVLFGEFFGTLGESFGIHPLWFDRGHNVQAIFLLSIGVGVGHIVLGLCLGVWQAVRFGNRHDLVEKVATLVSLSAIFLLVAVLTDFLPDTFFTPAIALLVVGLAVLIYTLGGYLGLVLGPLELLGTVTNILSYLRLAAIGLASVYLALVANELAGIFGNVLVGLIIAGFLHALNIVLGAFSPTIQSMRLHYVEFFSKFYQSGGSPFRPFQRSVMRR